MRLIITDSLNIRSRSIYCVGGMNIDRKYHLDTPLKYGTSNPVNAINSCGGVGRNIAENLGRLNQQVSLLSIAGDDADYQSIYLACHSYMDLSHIDLLPDHNTSSYTAVLDDQGEMTFAFADMAVCKQMNDQWIQRHQDQLTTAEMVVADLNLQQSGIEALIELCRIKQIPLILIPVSGPKMAHLPTDLEGVSWLIVNQDESESFFNHEVHSDHDLSYLGQSWLDLGIEQVILTRGGRPCLYCSKKIGSIFYQPPQNPHVVDVTGAGDSFSAGLIYGISQSMLQEECLKYAMANAYYTVAASQTVRPDLSPLQLKQDVQTLFY